MKLKIGLHRTVMVQRRSVSPWGQGAGGTGFSPWRLCQGSQGPCHRPSQEQGGWGVPGQPQPQESGAPPGHGQRPGEATGLWVAPAQQEPWLTGAGLWGDVASLEQGLRALGG